MRNWRIQQNYSVYGRDDQKIGTVGEVQGDYFKMDTGFLGLGTDYFVPIDAVTDVRDDRVYINATKDQLSSLGWESKPTGRTSTGSFRQDSDFATGSTTRESGLRSDTGERSMPLRGEELEVNRRQREAGEVTVSKSVEEEKRRVDVPYTKEEVYVEQRPASGNTPAGEIREGEEISVPVREEEIDISKRPVTRGEVVIGKNQVTEEKSVEETLRREVPHVEKSGNVREVDERTSKDSLTEEERRRRERGNL